MAAQGPLCTPALWVPEPLEPADRELLGCLQGESEATAPPQRGAPGGRAGPAVACHPTVFSLWFKLRAVAHHVPTLP